MDELCILSLMDETMIRKHRKQEMMRRGEGPHDKTFFLKNLKITLWGFVRQGLWCSPFSFFQIQSSKCFFGSFFLKSGTRFVLYYAQKSTTLLLTNPTIKPKTPSFLHHHITHYTSNSIFQQPSLHTPFQLSDILPHTIFQDQEKITLLS